MMMCLFGPEPVAEHSPDFGPDFDSESGPQFGPEPILVPGPVWTVQSLISKTVQSSVHSPDFAQVQISVRNWQGTPDRIFWSH